MDKTESKRYTEALCQIVDEYSHACTKHPVWPEDTVYAVAIMQEEAGEAVKAALDLWTGKGTVDELRAELAQAGAMCLRCLINLPRRGHDR